MKVKARLRPIVHQINLPTVIKTAVLPGDMHERLFIATQVGEIFFVENGKLRTFLNIRPQIIQLGESNGGYDERGLLGLAFHPGFYYNGLFYLHYSVAGTQGPGALPEGFIPDPCDPKTINLNWVNRETKFDHIDTVEEWIYQPNGRPQKRRTLLNLRRPFSNHNGVNSLHFSPETGKLILTTGDGGAGYDPFNLSQNDMEIAGKIIEIDVMKNTFIKEPPAVTRFDELPEPIQEMLTVMAKGVRNIPGISFQRFYRQYIKYAGNVGQDLTESIYSFIHYKPMPVRKLVQRFLENYERDRGELINFGWRGWEGVLPTLIMNGCSENPALNKKTIAFYNEAVKTSTKRIPPLVSYFHEDPRIDKFSGTALTGVQALGETRNRFLAGSVVFTDFARKGEFPVRGVLAYTKRRTDGKLNDFSVIETDNPFGSEPAYYVSLGTNMLQTKLYLGVYGSMRVTDYNMGSVYEVLF